MQKSNINAKSHHVIQEAILMQKVIINAKGNVN